MRTLERDCAGLQDGPVQVLLKIPNYTLSKVTINKQTIKKFLRIINGNKHPSAGLIHKSASTHSYQYVLKKHHIAACTNCPSLDTNSNIRGLFKKYRTLIFSA
jgi:hypothetical protein